jgi:hypothetical protein
VLSLFAEIFQVTGFADTARVQASLCVRTFGSHLLPAVKVVALLAEAAGVELPIRMGTTSRKLGFLRLVNPAVCLLDFTRRDDWRCLCLAYIRLSLWFRVLFVVVQEEVVDFFKVGFLKLTFRPALHNNLMTI